MDFRGRIDRKRKIRMEDGRCSYLDESGLCRIISRFSLSFLHHDCRYFPRIVNFINGRYIERTLSLSCPAAADLCLDRDNDFALTGMEDDSEYGSQYRDRPGQIINSALDYEGLRRMFFAVMKDDSLTIYRRLVHLYLLCSRLHEAPRETAPDPVEAGDEIRLSLEDDPGIRKKYFRPENYYRSLTMQLFLVANRPILKHFPVLCDMEEKHDDDPGGLARELGGLMEEGSIPEDLNYLLRNLMLHFMMEHGIPFSERSPRIMCDLLIFYYLFSSLLIILVRRSDGVERDFRVLTRKIFKMSFRRAEFAGMFVLRPLLAAGS
jgi:hypothetical protein